MFQPPSQSQEAAIGGQENNDLCFRSEYDFQLIAETYRELVKLIHNVPKFSWLISPLAYVPPEFKFGDTV